MLPISFCSLLFATLAGVCFCFYRSVFFKFRDSCDKVEQRAAWFMLALGFVCVECSLVVSIFATCMYWETPALVEWVLYVLTVPVSGYVTWMVTKEK